MSVNGIPGVGRFSFALLLFLAAAGILPACAANPQQDEAFPGSEPTVTANEEGLPEVRDPRPELVAKTFPEPENAVRLSAESRVWVDRQRQRLIVDGYVALQSGVLELFACPAGTKEHEAVVAVLCKAQEVHAGLLAIGAQPGSPVQYQPQYTPATGDTIKIWVLWKDAQGKPHRSTAQQWVKRTGTTEALKYDWVFAGSGFWRDEEEGRDYYLAESGDLICVSNFTSATLDLPIESSKANEDLLFSAFEEHVPPRGTPVRLVLMTEKAAQAEPEPQNRDDDLLEPKPKEGASEKP